ncbi:MAG: HNH endonuclease signature motif containing protein [Lachnospiraceae bacterium]|nr:HNH endonuclease signature motif containing protein [Lachnospiraceae bacterium]
MRPVDKGESPYDTIKEYQDALPYLEKKIGLYCSYCEMPINHIPEVEHIISRKHGGNETAWSNLLLGCKYCNSRKGAKTTPQNVGAYLWPDMDNTAVAFSYANGIPVINEDTLRKLDPTGIYYEKAKNTYEMAGLGNVPDFQKGDKDRRALSRNASYHRALESLKSWSHIKDAPELFKNDMKKQIMMTALADGFFSIWMTVFIDEPQILLALMENFSGTNRAYYDEDGKIKQILKKEE